MRTLFLFLALVFIFLPACSGGSSGTDSADGADIVTPPADAAPRADGAIRLEINAGGSLQNPVWSPESDALAFTRYAGGYNADPADIMILTLDDRSARTLVSDGSANVSFPGHGWHGDTRRIVFSSSRGDHDEIYTIRDDEGAGGEVKITNRPGRQAFEPSFSPDGQWIVFESHGITDAGDNGVITKYRIDGSGTYVALTGPAEDCRQPNWSPAAGRILYQKQENGRWAIWVMDEDGANHSRVTTGAGSYTDGSFSPDGRWIVYSAEEEGIEIANLFIVPAEGGTPVRITNNTGYDGAPAWSPDGQRIAFESHTEDPDGSTGTALWMIEVDPASLE